MIIQVTTRHMSSTFQDKFSFSFFKFRTMTIPIIAIIYIFTYFFSLHYFNYSTCNYCMVLCGQKKRAPRGQSPFWHQNQDYVGRAICRSSNWLYNICKCTIIFNIMHLYLYYYSVLVSHSNKVHQSLVTFLCIFLWDS